MHINDQEEIVQTGQSVYIPFNARQWIKNIGEEDLKFLCTVSPPWKKIDENCANNRSNMDSGLVKN